MHAPIERYTVDELLVRHAEIRVMTPELVHEVVHWHDFYELCYVIDGSARHTLNGFEDELEPSSAFLLSPADFHEIKATSRTPLTCYNVVIDPRVLDVQLTSLLPVGAEWTPWTTHGFTEAADDFARLRRESEQTGPAATLLRDALVNCLVVELFRRCVPQDRGFATRVQPLTGQEIWRAVRFVERHFREDLRLADVAAVAHLSPNYFSERFRVVMGRSFQAFLQNRRLQFAHALLRTTQLRVADVCQASGFNDLSHFGRAFRSRYGVAPSAVRTPPVRAGEEMEVV